ncbi:hypothetical protein BHM03_00025727 [Ensete ventricosum]|nr:hypothetical protein BHM03_00025727 [Ensete ventricosum]
MDIRGFFIGAREMCWFLGTSVGRSGTQAIASCWSRLLVFGGAVAARSLLQCFGGSRGDILLGKEGEQRRRDASGGQGGVRPIVVDVGAQRDCAAGGEPAAGQRAASGWGGDPPADLYAGAFLRSRPCSPPAQVLLRPRGQRFPHHRYPYLGGLTFLMYRLPLVECLMFGALISATDPVTVLSIFQVS